MLASEFIWPVYGCLTALPKQEKQMVCLCSPDNSPVGSVAALRYDLALKIRLCIPSHFLHSCRNRPSTVGYQYWGMVWGYGFLARMQVSAESCRASQVRVGPKVRLSTLCVHPNEGLKLQNTLGVLSLGLSVRFLSERFCGEKAGRCGLSMDAFTRQGRGSHTN